jgi:arylsulfotransferase ASST
MQNVSKCAALFGALVLVTLGCGGNTAGGGTAGTTGSAGTTGTAGTSATAGTTGMAGTGGAVSCTITASSSLSPMIATVGIVTWSTTLSGIQSAKIDFGLTTSYGMTAPVDLTQPSYRTLLLGMKAARMYHYRITAMNSGGSCQSQDYTIMTGPLPNGLVKPTVTTNNAAALAGGFILTGQYVRNANGSGPAYILDSDGDYVWWYTIEDYVTGVVMNYAGTHMWINNHPPDLADARVHRVTMDGMTAEDLSSTMPKLSHQLTVLPDETIAFYASDGGPEGCDDIKERAPNGTIRTIANSLRAINGTGACHVNNIQYSQVDDTLVFSDHTHCTVAKVRRSDGATVWILNGATKTFTGDFWAGSEHGIHVLGIDDFLIFTNNTRLVPNSTLQPGGTGDGSGAREIKLDLTAKTVTTIWSYKAMGNAYQTDVMGDLQRLPNGNIILAFGGKGIIQEIRPDGTVLQELRTTTNFGYIQKRMTLYGPPPR